MQRWPTRVRRRVVCLLAPRMLDDGTLPSPMKNCPVASPTMVGRIVRATLLVVVVGRRPRTCRPELSPTRDAGAVWGQRVAPRPAATPFRWLSTRR